MRVSGKKEGSENAKESFIFHKTINAGYMSWLLVFVSGHGRSWTSTVVHCVDSGVLTLSFIYNLATP